MLGELPFYVVRRGQIIKQTVAGSIGRGRFDTDTNDEDLSSQVRSGGDDASGFNASLAAGTAARRAYYCRQSRLRQGGTRRAVR